MIDCNDLRANANLVAIIFKSCNDCDYNLKSMEDIEMRVCPPPRGFCDEQNHYRGLMKNFSCLRVFSTI